jgi:hypothetical protein
MSRHENRPPQRFSPGPDGTADRAVVYRWSSLIPLCHDDRHDKRPDQFIDECDALLVRRKSCAKSRWATSGSMQPASTCPFRQPCQKDRDRSDPGGGLPWNPSKYPARISPSSSCSNSATVLIGLNSAIWTPRVLARNREQHLSLNQENEPEVGRQSVKHFTL